MTTPRLGAPELTAGQAVPETTVNEQIRYVEQGAGHFIFKDRDLATPPGSPSDGDCYLVATSPTGAWSGQAGKIAFRLSTAWLFLTAKEGFTAYVNDEDVLLAFNGSTWGAPTVSAAPSPVTTQAGTSYTAVLGDANSYIRFTNGSAVSFTIPPNSSVAFAVGTEINFIQAGAGALTLVAGSGVTLNSYGADLTLAGQWAAGTAKKVATDTWDVIGKFA